uniref:endo-polygalacturonase n=1 Tax=Lygus lineolaris TaxID=50650 RepID=A0A126CR10_LYGLI|nr:polygalacturonase 3a [Lygus lineolaris]
MNMSPYICGILMCVAAASAVDVWNLQQLEAAKRGNDLTINVRDIFVPAGQTLNFEFVKPGTTIVFRGRVTFGYKEWRGPLIILKGRNLKIKGGAGHIFDGEGRRWWDGTGTNSGKIKPYMFYVQLADSSVRGLTIKNSPAHTFAINDCNHISINNVMIDNRDGNRFGGHNTDGFDVAKSHRVIIANSTIYNQDDCLAINSGTDITFQRNKCIGGHGIAVAVGGYQVNEARNIVIRGCRCIQTKYGVRIKTLLNGRGIVKGVKIENILLKDVTDAGLLIIGNYLNSGPKGEPTGGIPIEDLTVNNVRGNVLAKGTNINVLVANARNWQWGSNIQGGQRRLPCKGIPNGLRIPCG